MCEWHPCLPSQFPTLENQSRSRARASSLLVNRPLAGCRAACRAGDKPQIWKCTDCNSKDNRKRKKSGNGSQSPPQHTAAPPWVHDTDTDGMSNFTPSLTMASQSLALYFPHRPMRAVMRVCRGRLLSVSTGGSFFGWWRAHRCSGSAFHGQTTSSGNEVIRTRSDAIVHASLEVKENVTVQGKLVQRSDQRTKGNIQPTGADEDAANLEHLRHVDIVSYDETQGPMAGQHVDHGFIAQNLQAEFPGTVQSIGPGIVDGAPVDDLIGVDHGAMLAVAFSAMKAVDRSEGTILSHVFVACILGDVPRGVCPLQ